MAVFDSQNYWFKSKIGPVEKGQPLHFEIRLEKEGNVQEARLILFRLGTHREIKVPMKKLAEEEAIIYSVECCFRQEATYEYYFEFIKDNKQYFVRRNWGSFEGKVTTDLNNLPWRLTVHRAIKTHPLMKKGIMYQIFPDRFWKGETKSELPKDRIYREWGELPYYDNRISQDFFKGNFNGIAEKLDYLKKLCIKVIYSNPIEYSSKNHRYAAIDYKQIDPVLGTKEELVNLMDLLHENGIIFIKDSVLNHVGSDSIYLDREDKLGTNGAYNHEDSPYKDWFYFYQNDKGEKDYADWWGDKSLAKLNYSSESLNSYMFGADGAVSFWFREWKIDGIREDVADELSNESRRKIYEIAKKEKGDKVVVIVEVWEDASNKANYGHRMEYLLGHETTSVMNYPVKDAILAYIRYGDFWGAHLKETLETVFLENYPREIAWSLMNFLSSHDTVRAITKLVGPEAQENDREWQNKHDTLSREEYILGRERLMISYLILYFLPGIPSIYYGDEVGLCGQKDPFNRKPYPWNRRDKKLLKFFKALGKFRHIERDFFRKADFEVSYIDEEICILERSHAKRQLFLVVNRSDHMVDIVKHNDHPERTKILFTTDKHNECKTYLNPHQGMILELF